MLTNVWFLLAASVRETAAFTNVGQLLEKHGKEFLNSRYTDPISSFSEFQKFSVSNPEVYFRVL